MCVCVCVYSYCAAMVMNVEVVIVSGGSVRVSWDHVILSELRGYIVYYREASNASQEEQTSTVTNTTFIDSLINGVLYMFQVAVMADLGTDETVLGERSIAREVLVTTNTQIDTTCMTSGMYNATYVGSTQS